MKTEKKEPKTRTSTPRTDAALDKDWTILDESLENVAKVSKELEIENGELFMAGYSARYILEDLNNEPGMWQMAKLTGLPMGVIVEAFLNIFAAHSAENVRDGRQLPATSRPELKLTHNPQKTNPWKQTSGKSGSPEKQPHKSGQTLRLQVLPIGIPWYQERWPAWWKP